MATVVDGYLRNWRSAEIDACSYRNGNYLADMAECNSSSFVKWIGESAERDYLRSNRNGADNTVDLESKQIRQCWKIRQFFNAIQKSWHKQGHVTVDALKSFPLILFSPILDRMQQRKDQGFYSGYFTDPNLSTPRTASETELFANISDQQQQHDNYPYDQFGFVRLCNPIRRHCNSESDLTCSLSTNPLQQLGHLLLNEDPQGPDGDELIRATSRSPEIIESLEAGTELIPLTDSISSEGVVLSTLPGDQVGELNNQGIGSITRHASTKENDPVNAVNDSPLPDCTLLTGHTCIFTCFNEPIQHEEHDAYHDETLGMKTESSATPAATTPRMQKSVSFADECGQALTEIIFIDNTDETTLFDCDLRYDGPMWPGRSRVNDSLFSGRFTRSRLKHRGPVYQRDPIHPNAHAMSAIIDASKKLYESKRAFWFMCFPQPAAQYYEFRQRLENGSVSLENITVTQPEEDASIQLPQLSGTIKVKNLSYEKQVWIRLTTDNWRSFTDFVALYSPKLSGGLLHSASRYDTFTFNLNVVPQMETEDGTSEKIEFAVRYLVGPDGSWGQHWDNNGGKNYVIERRIVQPSWPEKLTATEPRMLNRSTSCDSAFDGFSTDASRTPSHFQPYTQDYRPNFEGISQFTSYRAWTHFAGETAYY